MFENALLSASLRQMAILALFVGVGFVAAKGKVLPLGPDSIFVNR